MTECALRVAVCLSGMPKALIQPKLMRAHLLAVLQPLREDPAACIHIYLHLDCEGLGKACSRTLRSAASELGVRNLVLYRDRATLLSTNLTGIPRDLVACPVAAAPCCSAGYAAAIKWRGCLREIEAAEVEANSAYDFVLRLRPDIEHLFSLPPASEWYCLRRDIAFTMIALPNSAACHPGNVLPDRRLGGRPVLIDKHRLFIDDNLALLPRKAAQVYFSIADEFEHCVPTSPANKLCQRRWEW
eukprot:CAMPEP_0119302474 /NCGR_PEP_ID=MMETSP1333-20130426/4060_1 /TAXON_ID=418940 /ORGANISM="Scyphosphaera apsteinii, Strain RCC1455" /LENGTH=243 /DNA_ID=CAMNT_0007304837 /DNA_START=171 /DNA_END=899 /DNA_ORIENTATION=+